MREGVEDNSRRDRAVPVRRRISDQYADVELRHTLRAETLDRWNIAAEVPLQIYRKRRRRARKREEDGCGNEPRRGLRTREPGSSL